MGGTLGHRSTGPAGCHCLLDCVCIARGVPTPTAFTVVITRPVEKITVVVTLTPTQEPVLEMVEGTAVTEQGVLGEVEVEYPIRMSPATSSLMKLSIYVPPQLASLELMSVDRIEIPPDAPKVVGKHQTHHSTILVSETMRVELTSLDFAIEPHLGCMPPTAHFCREISHTPSIVPLAMRLPVPFDKRTWRVCSLPPSGELASSEQGPADECHRSQFS